MNVTQEEGLDVVGEAPDASPRQSAANPIAGLFKQLGSRYAVVGVWIAALVGIAGGRFLFGRVASERRLLPMRKR